VAPARLHPPLRNSWGLDRGMAGYFTIPYSSPIQPGLAADFWVIRQVR
jgi:C1A family cysteine protease